MARAEARGYRRAARRVLLAVVTVYMTLCSAGFAGAAAVVIGFLQDQGAGDDLAMSEWQWALRGGGVRLAAIDASSPPPEWLPLMIIDDLPVGAENAENIARWVADGGILLLTGVRSLLPEAGGVGQGVTPSAFNETMTRLAGVVPDYYDPGLTGTYPFVVQSDPLLSPLLAGDGLRLGGPGVGQALRLRPSGAVVLAKSAQIRPGPGALVYQKSAPTLTVHRVGSGLVFFASFSFAKVASCYPTADNRATDCSAAGTAHALMRWLVANLLWQELALQIPLPWETPGDSAVGLVITGDVHADEHNLQIRSARQMAKVVAPFGVPLTFYTVGDVTLRAGADFAALANSPHVEIAPHSAHGKQYRLGRSVFSGRRRGGVHGAAAVRDDVQQTETMLGLPVWPSSRRWANAIRTEGYFGTGMIHRVQPMIMTVLDRFSIAHDLGNRVAMISPASRRARSLSENVPAGGGLNVVTGSLRSRG